MLLRIIALGAILFAAQVVTAADTFLSTRQSTPDQTLTSPAPIAPHPSSGPLATPNDTLTPSDPAQKFLLEQKLAELDHLQGEVRRLQAATGTAQQLLFKVQMLEVSLTKLRNMGVDIDWFADGYVSEAKIRQLLSTPSMQADPSREKSETTMASNTLRLVDWLQRNNVAKVLANPTLVTRSGRPASVKFGGVLPLPSKDESQSAVQFLEYGTELNLLAVSQADNQVQLEVKLQVSELDYGHATEINGTQIPGLRTCQCDTGLQLALGQTAVLTGFVQQRTEARQVEGGKTQEVLNDVGLMVVLSPELVPAI